jgi:hypothetical protein
MAKVKASVQSPKIEQAVEEKCANCRFFIRDEKPEFGQCRRRSPDRMGWPVLKGHYWCGEFEKGESKS